jgi:hypothetical protein
LKHSGRVSKNRPESKKLRAYYHFIKPQQFHKAAFGVHPVRAALMETTDEDRARNLMELAKHRTVDLRTITVPNSMVYARCTLFR